MDRRQSAEAELNLVPMSPFLPLSLSLLCLFAFATAPSIVVAHNLSAYDILRSYDFPVGLLPKGVTGYDLDRTTGNFKAYLNGSCSFSLEGSYQLKYKPTISGRISRARITNLKGISVKVLFFWINIIEVVRTNDELEFSVGIASASFPVDNFYECPQCGCGLDCNGDLSLQPSKIRTNPFVSST